ncbi:MAG: hypothetical protein ABL934_07170 [Lysobacteraceae bacterium]
MDSAYKFLLFVHGLSGLVALIAFWIAAFAKKGSPLHVRAGKSYMIAMLGIVVTAIPMAIIIAMRGNAGTATFLGYLVVITASSMWLGRRAIRSKRDQTAFRGGAYSAVAVLNLLASIAVFVIGQQAASVLLMGFSAVGLFNGTRMLARRTRPLTMPRWWMKEHIAALIGCGVATHIAFLSIGLSRIIAMLGLQPPDGFGLIAWFGPLVVAVASGFWLNRKYVPKSSAGAMVASRV